MQSSDLLSEADAKRFIELADQGDLLEGDNDIVARIKQAYQENVDPTKLLSMAKSWLSTAENPEEFSTILQALTDDAGSYNFDALVNDNEAWSEMIEEARKASKLTELDLALKKLQEQAEAIDKVNAEYEQMNTLLDA